MKDIIFPDNGKPVTETTSYGGLVLAKANLTGQHPYEVDVSGLGNLEKIEPIRNLIEPLRAYKAEFKRRCSPKA